jgi:sugar phosphate isomerase/epimerase
MKPQNCDEKSATIRKAFEEMKAADPERFKRRIDISFYNGCFGLEKIENSVERLSKVGYHYIEIQGAGDIFPGKKQRVKEIKQALDAHGMKCSGFSAETMAGFSLSSGNFFHRQAAVDYLKANVEMCAEVGGRYYLLTPAACDTCVPEDDGDWDRSAELLHEIADVFTEYGVQGAVEPVAPFATSMCHTIDDAKRYIKDVDHAGVRHIYGDLGHMLTCEEHIGEAILDAGDMLLNLHLRDSHFGRPIGNGMIDLDTAIRALYLIGFNTEGHFAAGEPFCVAYEPSASGIGLFSRHSEEVRTLICEETIRNFRAREEAVLDGSGV